MTIRTVTTKFFTTLLILLIVNLTGWTQRSEDVTHIISLDLSQFSRQLSAAPMEGSSFARSAPMVVDLPMPDGSMQSFSVVESPIMDPDFASAFPDFKTYRVQQQDDPAISGRISITPFGYNAVILTPSGTIHASPLDINNPVEHQIQISRSFTEGLECAFSDVLHGRESQNIIENPNPTIANGANKRTFRMAIVTTGEFASANGGTAPSAAAAVTAAVNGIQAIYERELNVNFTLLQPFVYTDANTDPFIAGNERTTMAANAVALNFNVNDYDVGHVFHDVDEGAGNLGGGGVANLGAVCSNTPQGNGVRKAGGWSGSFTATGGFISLAAHEFGHMFNMTHTFNGTGESCTNNISTATAVEIGSGNTIMSYNGTCAASQNVPGSGVEDHYFHAISLDQAINFINGQTCGTTVASNNTPPNVNANPCGGNHTIPVGTPFRLRGSGSDANGDAIYYTWEQTDEDGDGTATQGLIGAAAAANAAAPLFRSYPPSPSPTRYFPTQELVAANNYASSFEPLPTVARTLNFRLTARDWRAGGGAINTSDLQVTVSASGPLAVTAPNGGENLTAGNMTTVTWNHNGSNAFCNQVNIRLSIDGGINFPYILSTNTANDGTENVTIPAGVVNSTTARIMVESACNDCVVFYDISNANFNITSTCQAPVSNICPVTALNLPVGDGGLNMGLNRYLGDALTAFPYNLNNNSPTALMANAVSSTDNTCQNSGNFWHQIHQFTVSSDGKYNFQQNPNDNGFRLFTIYQGDYNPGNPCAGYIASNSWGAWSATGGRTVDLVACTDYSIVIWSLDDALTGSMLVSGPGQVYPRSNNLPANYAYTYAAVSTADDQVKMTSTTSNFTGLAAGSYRIYGVSYYTGGNPPNPANPATWTNQTVSAILTGGTCVLFSSNYREVTVVGNCTPPTVNASTVVQPTCNAPGSITVNATGAGPFEYSIDNGTTFQANNAFAGLMAGTYNIVVRLQGDPACSATGTPVVLNAPTGCDDCATVAATDVPQNITDNNTITSMLTFPQGGTITDVNITSLNGTHTYVGDLTFTLISPNNTTVVLMANQCANTDNFNIAFDDEAVIDFANVCPPSDGVAKKPQNPLSAFDGQNPQGVWQLTVNDNANADQGVLNGWSLQICGNFNCAPTINSVTVVQPTCQNPNGTITVNATGNGALEYSVDGGTTFQAGNSFGNLPAANYNVMVRLQGNGACQAVYNQNPIVINAPVGCAECLTYVAGDVPIAITDNATITSTINVPRGGTLTDVNIKNLQGTHTYVSDLTFTLVSPMGTTVTFLQQQCGSADDFNISFDDQAGIAFACPMNDGQTKMPQNPLSAFNGENPQGNWMLMINDAFDQDQGSLTGWTLEVCGNFVNAACPPVLNAGAAPVVSNGVYQAEIQVYCSSTISSGNNVTFQAGNNVELRPNFTVSPNASLEVRIAGCDN